MYRQRHISTGLFPICSQSPTLKTAKSSDLIERCLIFCKCVTLNIKADSSTHKRSMKSVSLLALIASTAFALGQSKVASDYLNEPEKYEGKKIVLPCAYVQRASRQPDPQHVIFGALTTTKGSNSSQATQARSGSPSLLPKPAPSSRNTGSLPNTIKT
jgi:hypothetical protein